MQFGPSFGDWFVFWMLAVALIIGLASVVVATMSKIR
jgi:hypothetical protein